MANNRKLIVEIVGDASSLQRSYKNAERQTSGFGRSIGRVGKIAGLAAGGLAIGGLAKAITSSVSAAAESQAVNAQTAAVLKSTGNQAGTTAKKISDLAGEISRLSGVDDETIQSAENLLLTFTKVRNEVGKGNDVFNQATRTVVDMSVALGQDTKTSALQLGKALNDPIKGVGALQRVGVSFTKAQKEQIKALVDSGKTMEAQKIILRELQTEFGGSAEAAGKTFPGAMAKLKTSVGNVAEAFGSGLLPPLTKVANTLSQKLADPKVQKRIEEIGTAIGEKLGSAITKISDWVATHGDDLKQVWQSFSGAIVTASTASKVLVGGLKELSKIVPSDKLIAALAIIYGASKVKKVGSVLTGGGGGGAGGAAAKGVKSTLIGQAVAVTAGFGLAKAADEDAKNRAKFDTLTSAQKREALSKLGEKNAREFFGVSKDEFSKIMGGSSTVGASTRKGTVSKVATPATSTPSGQTVVVQHQTVVDGRVVEQSVTKKQQTKARRNPPQKRGIMTPRLGW